MLLPQPVTVLVFIAWTAQLAQAASLVTHDASFVPDIVLAITQINAALACVYRTSLVFNGTTPGPTITLTEGKITWIRVYNNVPDQNVTVHWHGLSQSAAPFSDGTPRASQWPIPPMHFFDYEIKPKVGEAGSYFYHSHVGFQAVSAAGALIVEEASGSPPYEYDEERIFFITELFNKTDTQIEQGLTANSFVWSGEAERVLVNGNGIRAISANKSQASPPDPPPRPGTPSCGPEIFYVLPSTTYRFRFISAAALSLVTLGFEGHSNLSIIEADGSYTNPHNVSHMQLGSGQRFDVLLHTKSSEELKALGKQSFYIQLEIRDRPINLTSYAVLTYSPQSYVANPPSPLPVPPKQPPIILPQTVAGWLEYALTPLKPTPFPPSSAVTRRIYLRNDQFFPSQRVVWKESMHQWLPSRPGKPYLVQIYENGESAIPSRARALRNGGWDPVTNTWPAAVGEVIEIILLNIANSDSGTNDVHPWHAHGGHFFDIGSGPGMYNATANEAKLVNYHPVKRDTTVLYKEDGGASATAPKGSVTGWRGWRLQVEDAGVFLIHCHTTQHMLMGLQSVWVMGNASQITANKLTVGKGYFSFGGNVVGNETFSPTVAHFFEPS